MKKVFILFFILFSSIFLTSGKYSVDVDYTPDFIFNSTINYNVYGLNYQGYGPYLGKKVKIQKGDKITIEIAGVSTKNIQKLYFSLVDRSVSSSYWKYITPKYDLCMENIVKDIPFKYTFSTTIVENPSSTYNTQVAFMHEDANVKALKLKSCKMKILLNK